jgi:hypothetical protein
LQFPQCLIGHDTKRAQGVIVRNSLLGAGEGFEPSIQVLARITV